MAETVSVVICVRDGAAFLDAALDSVLSEAAVLEVLVVNDASSDDTRSLLARRADSRLRVFHNDTPLGPFASANLALEHATGAFIARLDADDVSRPGRFEAQLATFAARPSLGILGTGCRRLDASGGVLGVQAVPAGREVILRAAVDPPFVHSSVMWRASLGLRYASELTIGGDYELWSRALLEVEADNLPEPLVDYRAWSGSLSSRRRDAQTAIYDAVSWRFASRKWALPAERLPAHRALRAWGQRSEAGEPLRDAGALSLLEELARVSGGDAATLRAPLGTLGQPRLAA